MINEKTYVEIRGRHLFMLEGLKHITEYGSERISLNCGDYTVSIGGKELSLAFLADNRISVEGRINTIEYIEKQSFESR